MVIGSGFFCSTLSLASNHRKWTCYSGGNLLEEHGNLLMKLFDLICVEIEGEATVLTWRERQKISDFFSVVSRAVLPSYLMICGRQLKLITLRFLLLIIDIVVAYHIGSSIK